MTATGISVVSTGEALDAAGLKRRGLLAPPFNLGELIAQAAADRADEAWLWKSETSAALSHGEAAVLSDRVAHALIRDGFLPGDRIAILMANHLAFGPLVGGVWKAGGSLSALHPAHAEALLKAQLQDLKPKFLFVSDEPQLHAKASRLISDGLIRLVVAPQAGGIDASTRGSGVSFGAWLAKAGRQNVSRFGTNDSAALLQFTAGSTGAPKAAVLTHGNISTNLGQLAQVLPRLGRGQERILAIAPFAHAIGFSLSLCMSAYLASRLVLVEQFDPEALTKLCVDERITFLNAVPTLLEGIKRSSAAQSANWQALKYVISGGAPLPTTLKGEFESLTHCHVLQGYGLSETSPGALVGHPSWPNASAESTGRPLPDTRFAISAIEDPNRFLAEGEIGEIRIGGPQVMQGYWRRPRESEAALSGGLLRTGDLGRIDENGNITIVGRLKELIIASGYNVYPARVEDAILTHSLIDEAAVVGVPDEYRGETVKAVVVCRPGATMDLALLQAWLAPRLSPMELPRILEIRDALPKSPAGKVLKQELL